MKRRGFRTASRFAFVVALLVLAVPGWGYWHASSHGALHVLLYDVALKTDRQAYGTVLSADVAFSDAEGQILANGRAAKPWGTVSMVHPSVGDCQREERQGGSVWQECFESQSRWLIAWVPLVRSARIRLDTCTIDRAPVQLEQSRDAWWLWWVPLPHIDNSTYTHFTLTSWIDSADCVAVAADPLRASAER